MIYLEIIAVWLIVGLLVGMAVGKVLKGAGR